MDPVMDNSVEFVYELMLTRSKLIDRSKKKQIVEDLREAIEHWDTDRIHVANILF